MNTEHLSTAHDNAGICANDLQRALKNASAVESIILLGLISEASALELRINRLLSALREGAE